MKTYRIRPLALTRVEQDMSVFTYRFHYGRKIQVPHTCWYIEGADQHILVDTAASAEMARSLRGFEAQDIISFEDALGSLNLRPEDIDIVVQTHLQWDHCGNTSKCKNAKVICAEAELLFALSPHPILAPTYRRELLKDLDFTLVQGYCEIIPGLELIPAPGHTPGTLAVSVGTEKGRAVLTGFCSLRENFEPPEAVREILPVIAPGIHLNAVEAFETALRIKSLADILIPMHDPASAEAKSIP
jgi:N-acyl homoserine lactone hydrolase